MLTNKKPNSDQDVLTVMQEYCQSKGYTFSSNQLDYMAQNCYLYFESRGWKGISYWPAVCMRWVLNNLSKQVRYNYKPNPQKGKSDGKSIRDILLEKENNE